MNEIQKKNFINKIIKFMQYLNLNNDFLVNYLSIEQMYYIEREYRKVCKIKYPKRIKEYQENYRKKNRDKIRIYHREYKRKTKQKEYQNLKIKKQKMYEMVRERLEQAIKEFVI